MTRKRYLARATQVQQRLETLLANPGLTALTEFIQTLGSQLPKETGKTRFFGELELNVAQTLLKIYQENQQDPPPALRRRVENTSTTTPNRGTAPPTPMNIAPPGSEPPTDTETPPEATKSASPPPVRVKKEKWLARWWPILTGIVILCLSITVMIMNLGGDDLPTTKQAAGTTTIAPTSAGDATVAAASLVSPELSQAIATLAAAQADARKAVAAAEARAVAAEAALAEEKKYSSELEKQNEELRGLLKAEGYTTQ